MSLLSLQLYSQLAASRTVSHHSYHCSFQTLSSSPPRRQLVRTICRSWNLDISSRSRLAQTPIQYCSRAYSASRSRPASCSTPPLADSAYGSSAHYYRHYTRASHHRLASGLCSDPGLAAKHGRGLRQAQRRCCYLAGLSPDILLSSQDRIHNYSHPSISLATLTQLLLPRINITHLRGISLLVIGSYPTHFTLAFSQLAQLGSLWSQRFFLNRHLLHALTLRKLLLWPAFAPPLLALATGATSSSTLRGLPAPLLTAPLSGEWCLARFEG